MALVADVADAAVGVDTHQDTHTLEMVSPSGTHLARVVVPNTNAGFAEAIAWIVDQAPGARVFVGVEGARSYGVGLARALAGAGLRVVEAEQPAKKDRRRRGKSDVIDAHLVALATLRLDLERLPTPRADGDREALRMLLVGRRELVETRTRTISRLRALLLTGSDEDREIIGRGRVTDALLRTIIERELPASADRVQRVRAGEARRLAELIARTTAELATNKSLVEEIVDEIAPALLEKRGVGPVSAGQAIVSWSHQGRCRNEGAFAALAGASPVEASSGRTTRHRLNRGGDRAMNRALHDIVLTRWRCCPRTRSYVERRRAEGRNDRDIRRTLKRYVARELFNTLNSSLGVELGAFGAISEPESPRHEMAGV